MSKEMIMILTDDNSFKNNLINKLKSWDYTTCTFPIESPVVTESDGIKPDLILMDITPNRERDGLSVGFDLIKNFDLPLIYLSNESLESLDATISTKPYNYILKPFNGNELKLAVEMALYYETDKKLKAEMKQTSDFSMITHQFLTNLLTVRDISWRSMNHGYQN